VDTNDKHQLTVAVVNRQTMGGDFTF